MADGRRCVADTFLGTDGESSACRDVLYGYRLPPRDSRGHVFRVTVRTSDIINHVDLVDLVQVPYINLWARTDSSRIAYPLKNDDIFSLTPTCAHDPSTKIEHVPHRVEVADVRHDFSQRNSKYQRLLDLAW